MRRVVTLLLPMLLLAPVLPAAPASADPPPAAPGWTVDGDVVAWTSPAPVPLTDAGVEFWEGNRLLGRPSSSPDMRTFVLKAHRRGAGALEVRASGRRLDVTPPELPTAQMAPASLPPLLPDASTDPGTPGPFATGTGEYTLDSIRLPGYVTPIEMQAVVVAPKGAPGKRPLVLFLHGRHLTCYSKSDPANTTAHWPCPAGLTPAPSYRGYLKTQQLLASQGYVTVSISANGINAQDALQSDSGAQARSSLVRTHLAKWADWAGAGRGSAPGIVKDAPAADMSKVMLAGHSRGGEGVNRAATDSLTPPPGDTGFGGPVRWMIKGTVLIGPTIFGHNPAPDVPSVTFLPGCDGDVADLSGQMYVDKTRGVGQGTALHSALYIVGANHNYFNSEWTPGQSEAPSTDDFRDADSDAVCSPQAPTRLTANQQQAVGATYTAAAARLFLARDAKVLPLLDGTGVRAPSAGPARVLSHAVGADRKALVVPDAATRAEGSARICAQRTSDTTAACLAPGGPEQPHFVGFSGLSEEPDRLAVALQWSAQGELATVRPAGPVSLTGARALALRLIVPPNSPATGFGVAVTDHNGQRMRLGSVSVTGLPATSRLRGLWAQEVRVPLPASGVGRVVSLELTPESPSGQAWLMDAYGWGDGLPVVLPRALPRLDVGEMTVEEGQSGTNNLQFPITVTGNGGGTVRVYVADETGMNHITSLVTIKPGQRRIDVPIPITGNTRFSWDVSRGVSVQPVRGVVAGASEGGLLVRNDDPAPTATASPVADRVTEGGTLAWKVTLSSPADISVYLNWQPLAVTGAPELSTTDVDPGWLKTVSGEEPLPSRPLSSVRIWSTVMIPAGQTSADFQVPTSADAETEPEEQVRLRFEMFFPESNAFEVSATVADAAT
ncbi:alpha/beta hydrolase family protein [Lentzea sp. NPDC051213]|uniref:alpha/beta hydrolase family protein n=1 Tax=Lentzea sp. NPDC051213 TaxID=3364126 RepID=UPI00379014F6